MDKGTTDVLRLGKKRRSNRRSSILKTRSPSRALSEIDPNAPLDDDVTTNTKKNRHSRRVSFSATCQIKEFLKDGHWQTANQAAAAKGSAQPDKTPATPVLGLDLLLKGPIQDPVVGSAEGTPVEQQHAQQTAPGARNVDSSIPPRTFSPHLGQDPETPEGDPINSQFVEQVANKTQLFDDDNGDMDMTTCITEVISLNTTVTHSQPNKRRSIRGSADHTQLFGDNADMDFTTCDDDVFTEDKPNDANKVDTMSALSRIMSAPKQASITAGGTIMCGASNSSNRTIMQSADMDLTTCNTVVVDRFQPTKQLETSAALFRIMSGKKTQGGTGFEKTMLFSSNQGEMDITECLTQHITVEDKQSQGSLTQAGGEKTQIFDDNADMDFTACVTGTADISYAPQPDNKVDTLSALSRIMSAPRQSPVEKNTDSSLASANKVLPNQTVVDNADLDFTRCDTAPISVPSSACTGDKLETASVLSRIMSGKKSLPSQVMLEKTCVFDKGEDMEMTTCLQVSKENTDGAMGGGVEGEQKRLDHTVFDAAGMDFTRCHTAAIEVAPTLDTKDKLKTSSALSRIMSGKNKVPVVDTEDKLKTSSALSRIMSGKNTDSAMVTEAKLETSGALSRIMSGKNISSQNVKVDSNTPQSEPVQKVDATNFLTRISGTNTISTTEDRNEDKTKIFTEDGDSAAMDFTQCLTTNFTASQQMHGQSYIGSKSVMEKTCVFDGGEEMEITTCLSKTQLEAFQQGKRDLELQVGHKESIEAPHRSANLTTIEGTDMDFTTCNTTTIEYPKTLGTDKLKTAVLVQMSGKKSTTTTLDPGSVSKIEPAKVDQTRIFSTEDGDSAVMEFTQCLTSNFTEKDQMHSKSSMEKTCVFEKGENMEFTACLSRAQLQEPKEDVASRATSQLTTSEKISDQTVITDVDMELTACTNITLKASVGETKCEVESATNKKTFDKTVIADFDMELTTCANVTLKVPEMESKRLECTTFDAVDMDFTACSTVHTADPQHLNREDKPGVAQVHPGEESEALTVICHDRTKVFNTGEDMEMTACLMGPPLSLTNVIGLNEGKSFTERTRHYSQGSDDMEFTGQIADVIVSGHALEQQQKENSVAPAKLSKRSSVGLTVRTSDHSVLEIPVVKPVRPVLTDVSHNFSTSTTRNDMDITTCPEKPNHQRKPSVSDTDSDQDILRPDDGVPIRLGAIIAPRITEDGCIYTQATFDKSLKFIGDIDNTGLFENQSRLETLVETSREASSACQSVSEGTSLANLSSLEKTQASSQSQSICPKERSSQKDSNDTEQLDRISAVQEPEAVPELRSQPEDSKGRKNSIVSENGNHTVAPEDCVDRSMQQTNAVDVVSNNSCMPAQTDEDAKGPILSQSNHSSDTGENKTKLFNESKAANMEMTMCDGEDISLDDHSENSTSTQSQPLPDAEKINDGVSLCGKEQVMHAPYGQNTSLDYTKPEHEPSAFPKEQSHMADPLAHLEKCNSIYGETLDMDLSLEADFPATEDLIPISLKPSCSKKRHSSDDLENASCSQNESKVAKISEGGPKESVLEKTECIKQTRNEGQSTLDGSKDLLKPVLSKPLGPAMSRSYGEPSIYNMPLMGTSSSQLSLIEMSHLDDVQPQTIDDYLKLFNIRKVETRRNSTNVKALNLEEPTDTASLLKQAFINAPRLELLQAATAKLSDRKNSIKQSLDKVEEGMMQELPQIFKDVMTVSGEEKSAMVKKYRDMYKACSTRTRATLKGFKCDFIKSLNLKYQEQVHVAERLRGELLDKIEFSSEVQQLIEEVHTGLEQDLQQLGCEDCATPEQSQQLVTLNQRLEELKTLCEEKENDLRTVQRKILEATEKQKVHEDKFIDQLNMLIPKSCQGQPKDQLRMTKRLSSWRTTSSSKEEHIASFIFDSLLLHSTFTSGDGCNGEEQLIKELTLTSKLADESADYVKLSHQFVLTTFDGEKLRGKYQMEKRLNDVLQDVAIQVAIASDLGVNVVDIGVVHKVQVEGFRITIGFVSLAAFAKFDLIVTIDPTTYPTREPIWRITSFIGSTSISDIEPHIHAVEPGLGYLYRIVCAVDSYLESKEN